MKKLFLLSILALAFSSFGLLFNATTVHAGNAAFWNYYCSVGSLDSAGCHGYFTGQVPPCISSNGSCVVGNIEVGGMEVSNATGFIAAVATDLLGGTPPNPEDTCGAAFIIDNMMNHPPFGSSCAQGIATADNYWGDGQWANLVQSYANSTNPNYGINWNVLDNPIVNSSWYPSITDDIFSHNTYWCTNGVCGGPAAPGDPQVFCSFINCDIPVIQFYFPGGSFEIERPCANLVGNLDPIPAIPPPSSGTINISCNGSQQVADIAFSGVASAYVSVNGWNSSSYTSSPVANIGIPVSATNPYGPAQTVTLYGGPGPPIQLATAQTQVPCASLTCGGMSVSHSPLDPYTPFSATVSVNNNLGQAPPGATMSLSLNPSVSFKPPGASQLASGSGSVSTATFNLNATGKSGTYTATWTLSGSGITKSCNGTFPVSYLPYLQIFGGDTITGASPTSASSQCSYQPEAGVFSWNNGLPNYSGAGDQFAVQAVGQIEDFASAQNSSPPTGLSFANAFPNSVNPSPLNSSQGLFGGDFGAYTANCDFTSDLSGVTQQAGSTVNVPSTVAGTVNIYAKGNVYIKNNVIYSGSGSWTSPSQIPDFRLVVIGGNIYIDSSVTELDGLYVAESNGTTGGTIYTCATGGLPTPSYGPTGTANAISNYYQTCSKQLIIYGSFVAQQVQFLRTYGSVGQATTSDTATSNHSAEVFDYTPEMWLPRATGTPNSGYTAITGLPPVL